MKKDYCTIGLILLNILLVVSLWHGYNMEKNCQSICEEKYNPIIESCYPTNQYEYNISKGGDVYDNTNKRENT